MNHYIITDQNDEIIGRLASETSISGIDMRTLERDTTQLDERFKNIGKLRGYNIFTIGKDAMAVRVIAGTREDGAPVIIYVQERETFCRGKIMTHAGN